MDRGYHRSALWSRKVCNGMMAMLKSSLLVKEEWETEGRQRDKPDPGGKIRDAGDEDRVPLAL